MYHRLNSSQYDILNLYSISLQKREAKPRVSKIWQQKDCLDKVARAQDLWKPNFVLFHILTPVPKSDLIISQKENTNLSSVTYLSLYIYGGSTCRIMSTVMMMMSRFIGSELFWHVCLAFTWGLLSSLSPSSEHEVWGIQKMVSSIPRSFHFVKTNRLGSIDTKKKSSQPWRSTLFSCSFPSLSALSLLSEFL